jgi:hypothetical protein
MSRGCEWYVVCMLLRCCMLQEKLVCISYWCLVPGGAWCW